MDRSEQALTIYAELEEITSRARDAGLQEVAHLLSVASMALSEEVEQKRLHKVSIPQKYASLYLN